MTQIIIPTHSSTVSDSSNNHNLDAYYSIKKYFINLDNRTDRLESIRAQVGDDFIRCSACYGNQLTWDDMEDRFDLDNTFKFYRCHQSRQGASAAISQYQVFQQVVADDTIADQDFVLISEDDNQYVPQFKQKLSQILEFLAQPRFSDIQICILKYFEIDEQIDYAYELTQLDKQHRKFSDPGVIDELVQRGFSRKKLEILKKYDFHYFLRAPKLVDNSEQAKMAYPYVVGFDYQGLAPSPEPELYTSRQNFLLAQYVKPYSASCYLIRKSVCKKILQKYSRPWWFSDDFKQFVPVNKILFASPFLATESPTARISSISTDQPNTVNETTITQYRFNEILAFRYKYQFAILKKFPFLLSYRIADSAIKRNIAKGVQKLLGINY